jgi:hypothetical protein
LYLDSSGLVGLELILKKEETVLRGLNGLYEKRYINKRRVLIL